MAAEFEKCNIFVFGFGNISPQRNESGHVIFGFLCGKMIFWENDDESLLSQSAADR